MKKTIFNAALCAVFCCLVAAPALAEDIAPTYTAGDMGKICWSGIGNGDTVQEAEINLPDGHHWLNAGQLYHFGVTGTTTGLDIELQAGPTGDVKDIDTDQMPDGVRFSSASTGNFGLVCLVDGDRVDLKFNSSGTGDAAACLTPVGNCR